MTETETETTQARIDRLSWFDELDPLCFTLVEGIDEDEALRRLGGNPAEATMQTRAQYWDHVTDYRDVRYFVGVGTGPDGLVFAIEENGYTGHVPGVLRDLSRGGGRAFCVYTHVNAADGASSAVDGELIVFEEPWGPLTPLTPGDQRWDDTWCAGLTDEPNDVWLRDARLLVAVERIMGTRVEAEWFDAPLRTVELPDPMKYASTDAWNVP